MPRLLNNITYSSEDQTRALYQLLQVSHSSWMVLRHEDVDLLRRQLDLGVEQKERRRICDVVESEPFFFSALSLSVNLAVYAAFG